VNWHTPAIQTLIQLALREDQARADITSRLMIPSSIRLKAVLRAKQDGVVCGLPLAIQILKAVSPALAARAIVKEGSKVVKGQPFLSVQGSGRSILEAERPALNAIQHLSGIATLTARCRTLMGRSKTRLLDTRKTIPGWRALEKYAVACGGGANHRMSLGDAILVKENHIDIARRTGSDWVKTLQSFRKKRPSFPMQVEIQTVQDLQDALRIAPQRVLLDNLPDATLKKMIKTVRKELPNTEIEISGGVSPEDLPRLSRLGVERISMGKLTHSAPAFDCSLDILNVR